jgi:hypothetical protein
MKVRRYLKKENKFWEEVIAYFPLIRHEPHRRLENLGGTQSKVIS